MKVSVTASCFDLLHAGHCLLLKEAREASDKLVVFLHIDPSIERKEKNKPILSLNERRILLQSNKYVDEIIEYSTEDELYFNLLNLTNVYSKVIRFLGDDYKNKRYTGDDIEKIEVRFSDRSHGYSSSDLRRRIFEVESQKLKAKGLKK